MDMLLRIFSLVLFLSLIVLLHLTLGKKNKKVGRWLTVAIGTWTIVLIAYLPIFHLVQIARLNAFLSIFGIILSLVIVHLFGRIMMWAVDRSSLSDYIKQFFDRYVDIIFNTAIFWFYFLMIFIASIIALQK